VEAKALEASTLNSFRPSRFDAANGRPSAIICEYILCMKSGLSFKNCLSIRVKRRALGLSRFSFARTEGNSFAADTRPPEAKDIGLAKPCSDSEPGNGFRVRREFLAEPFKLFLRDPSRLVLFFMRHLYFGGFVEPSPADGCI
jgi:hypothetical protein